MSARTTLGRRLAAAATTAVLSLGVLAGCGGEDDPLAPLYETLGQIDDSIVAGEYDQARDQVADLLDQVSQARTGGDMTKPAATRIREAAKALRSELARAEKEEAEDEEPTDTPTTPDSTGGEEQPSDEPSDEPTEEPTDEPSDEPTTSEPTTPRPTRTPSPAEPTPDQPDPTEPADPGTSGAAGTSGTAGASGDAGVGEGGPDEG